MEFRIDFSEIDFIALKSSGIKLSEVRMAQASRLCHK